MPESREQLTGQLNRPGNRPENVTLVVSSPEPLIQTFTDQDTTPSVSGFDLFQTGNTVATTITDFDDGRVGQVIYVLIKDTNTTIDFTASGLLGNVGVDWTPTIDDHMTCVYDGTDWHCTISDNTA